MTYGGGYRCCCCWRCRVEFGCFRSRSYGRLRSPLELPCSRSLSVSFPILIPLPIPVTITVDNVMDGTSHNFHDDSEYFFLSGPTKSGHDWSEWERRKTKLGASEDQWNDWMKNENKTGLAFHRKGVDTCWGGGGFYNTQCKKRVEWGDVCEEAEENR